MNRGRKYQHLKRGETSLEVLCLRDGTLDVDCKTGKVYSVRNGVSKPRRIQRDSDGYYGFTLNRERKGKIGKPQRERAKNGKDILRYRKRRYVLVHRLVKVKSIAVKRGGKQWREFVTDLPPGIDVNHKGSKGDNRDHRLELMTERANRTRTEMTDKEYAEVQAAF